MRYVKIDVNIEPGNRDGVRVKPDGAGETILLKLFSAPEKPTEREVDVLGHDGIYTCINSVKFFSDSTLESNV